ncbi:hypothetical protein ALC57_05622 [Trachymyrmex cornetzi]|uniref:Endonuclease/exonuclease/phosphatase domain-containing protein n=1 Tax=Trachymyrmex cornetzi TaxID=471704 RepID=A0A151JAJ2_9HYME|nr:hypothetical protein ALC57_05622 [Trachymyrmex cornetzi]
MEKKLESLAEWMKGKEEGIRTVIGGDFNARTGSEGGRIREVMEGEEEEKKRSRDRKNKVGGKLVEFIRERGWSILNGDVKEDEEGNWTYTERRGRLQERYLKWVLGIERGTPGYLVREELQREKLRVRAGKRAWAFEERLKGNGGRKGWMRKRRQFFEDRGMELESWQRGELEGERLWDELWERDRELQRLERWEKIRVTRYNRWYGWVKGKGVPEYLRKGWGEGRWRRVGRFRLENEVREGRYWEGEEERKGKLCGSGKHGSTYGRVVGRTGEVGGWQEVVGKILREEWEGG